MKLTKNGRKNLERLIWSLCGMIMVPIGCFVKDLFVLVPLGSFMIGVSLGQLK